MFGQRNIHPCFQDKVTVLEEQSSYTGFHLIVDIGSSLGLWVGVSALGIFDLLIDFVHNVRFLYYSCRKSFMHLSKIIMPQKKEKKKRSCNKKEIS